MAANSEESSPTDFAFEPPSMEVFSEHSFKHDALKTPGYATNGNSFASAFTPSSASSFLTSQTYPGVPTYTYSANSASSFSSGSGSIGSASFSSADALPAISRDFVRPSENETRRPATAGGALQSRSPFGGFMTTDTHDRGRSATAAIEDNKPETIDEGAESIFANPFGSPDKTEDLSRMASNDLDLSAFTADVRRATEPQFHPLSIQTSWDNANTSGLLETPEQPQGNQSSPHNQFPLTSAPPNVTQFSFLNGPPQQQMQMQRPQTVNFGARPQTSDGIPSYGALNAGGVSLPSARTIVSQIDPSGAFTQQFFTPQTSNMMPFRDARAASLSDMSQPYAAPHFSQRHYSIATERPRAGYVAKDSAHQELTFVPLGGPTPKKRPRRRYDEIERLYLCGWNGCEKSYGTLNHLNAHVAMQKHGEKRLPSEFKDMRKQWRKKKRDQAAAVANAQYMSANPSWQANGRPSIANESDFDRRDSVASIFSSASEYDTHRGSLSYPNYSWPPADSSRPNTSSSVASTADGRQFVQGYNHSMLNAVPVNRRASVPSHMALPPGPTAQSQLPHGDHPTPTQQNPYADRADTTFFQTLTSPMPAGTQFGQTFAFQR
ncbi:hypothetical protein BD324DRAFT_618896 [Kockovaella imperatae]|uniref:C2H2-type domain-containing protein n=1 Tax=Kockovaella imperatae TaxID=4999 RepID=A0A1Y1UNW2_9TREE|nr:hypothetical protein BD324DRAFT_618896 [Kockovaella imperatae]ORX39227.1 hypothetical protein BD324DRAFT_618896 [Kockovaella imperatae]